MPLMIESLVAQTIHIIWIELAIQVELQVRKLASEIGVKQFLFSFHPW